jgi:hypothetical protein
MGWAICERVFPLAFAAGAVVPLAFQSVHAGRHRARLVRFALGVTGTVVLTVTLSLLFFGADSFRVFAVRLARDAGVHNVLHVGLDKILTYRSWVPSQSFWGYEGLARFRHWNERINETWHDIRLPAAGLQLALMSFAAFASRRRHPFEASVLVGVTGMFTLASPASYYYVILALVPVVLLRSATIARPEARVRELAALLAFQAFWLVTLVAPQLVRDPIVFDLQICVALALSLVVWIGAWTHSHPSRPSLLQR